MRVIIHGEEALINEKQLYLKNTVCARKLAINCISQLI